ncbi:MAG TPA: nucleoside hydrolase, partial [Allocoleopsis sp.]
SHYGSHDAERFGMAGSPLHDPCVIAYLLQPHLFTTKKCHVTVETQSELAIGRTMVDWWHVTDRVPNVNVVQTIDAAGFYQLLLDRLAQL